MIGVLFDLDGVLVNSEPLYTQFWAAVEKIFPTGIPNFPIIIKGNNLSKILSTYFPDKKIQAQIIGMIDDFENEMQYDIFPGVMNFIYQLEKANIPRAIVTSSDISKVNRLYVQYPHFSKHFNSVITGDMVTLSKPDPECFLLGSKELNVDIKDCYVFEDSFSGITAGKIAGAKVIALSTTFAVEDLLKYKPDEIIKDFTGFTLNDMLSINKL